MSDSTSKLYDIEFPSYLSDEISFKEKYGKTYILKYTDSALLTRIPSAFGYENLEVEVDRRIEASNFAKSKLPNLVLDTNFIRGKAKLEKDGKIESVNLLARSVPWLENVSEVKDYKLDEVLNDPILCRDISKISFFVLKTFFTKGEMFDIFVTFEQAKKSKSEGFLKFLSNNIMQGFDSKQNKTITFIDPDWYFKISDRFITGFPLQSYLKRIFEGIITLTILCVFTFIVSLRSVK